MPQKSVVPMRKEPVYCPSQPDVAMFVYPIRRAIYKNTAARKNASIVILVYEDLPNRVYA